MTVDDLKQTRSEMRAVRLGERVLDAQRLAGLGEQLGSARAAVVGDRRGGFTAA